MLNQELIDIVARKVRLDIAAQEDQIAVDVSEVRCEANGRGMLYSSITVLGIEQVHVLAMQARVTFVWAHLRGCIETAGVRFDDGLSAELKTLVTALVPEKPEWQPNHETVRLGLSNIQLYSRDNIQKTRVASLERVFAEIDLFMIAMKKPPPVPHHSHQIFNIRGSSVANLQTGAGSSATVTQSVAHEEYANLKRALEELRSALMGAKWTVPSAGRDEVVDMVDESVRELGKEKPNRTKLAAFVAGIGTSLQGAVGLAEKIPGALQSFKAAWAAISPG
jgi:hypothetical protein